MIKEYKRKISIPLFLNDFMDKIISGQIRTGYSHVMHITAAFIKMDCSGFVAYVLEQTGRKAALDEIMRYKYMHQKTASDWNKAYVRNFVSALTHSATRNWKILGSPTELIDGDIIFSVNATKPIPNTNHCMFVRSITRVSDYRYKINVMDSTYNLIHYNDTRNHPGIGCGDIFIEKTARNDVWLCNYSESAIALNKRLVFARPL